MKKVRIVVSSDFNKKTYKESFLDVPLMDATDAQTLCSLLNKVAGHQGNYYKFATPDYELSLYAP